MKRSMLVVGLVVVLLGGCGSLRFAPGEAQKQNAWLHNRTAQVAADMAKSENASIEMQDLTLLSEVQSRAFCADYGLPKEFPPAGSFKEIVSESNRWLAESAFYESSHRPDVWDMADSAVELGIGIAALFGGVYGVRVAGFLKQAKTRSKALREIVEGNEIFKRMHAESVESFKAAHKGQSSQTRQIVAETKST